MSALQNFKSSQLSLFFLKHVKLGFFPSITTSTKARKKYIQKNILTNILFIQRFLLIFCIILKLDQSLNYKIHFHVHQQDKVSPIVTWFLHFLFIFTFVWKGGQILSSPRYQLTASVWGVTVSHNIASFWLWLLKMQYSQSFI